MAHADFVHLRVHTAYSLSEGAIQPADLARLCQQRQMPAVAISDTNNLFGALEFAEAMVAAGVQPIVGIVLAVDFAELTAPADARERAFRDARDERASGDIASLLLLAKDETGYRNLMALSSDAFVETASQLSPRVSLAALAAASEGLLATTGGLDGPLAKSLSAGDPARAQAIAAHLAALFPDRLYVEIQRHGLQEERAIEPGLLDLAYGLDLPLLATNDVYFADPSMHEAHDVLLCISQSVVRAHDDRRRVPPDCDFKAAAEMRDVFADLPEAVDNTLVVAQRCAFRPKSREPIPPRFSNEAGANEPELLRSMSREGLETRLQRLVFADDMDDAGRNAAAAPYRERLAYELDVVVEMGFAGYFLIVADFIQWAKRQDIPVGPGRGSGAGSIVAWALQITDLDPLRFGLLFERFLNPDRVSMPDFDIDFCQDRRDEVIAYVQDKYGSDQVAQIITFGKLQARAVVRDVGRVLGMPYGQVDRLAKLVPYNPANPVSLAKAIENEPRLGEERDTDPEVARLLDIALKLEGLYRHASTHAAGVVIGERPLRELVPLYRDPRAAMPATQFNMKWVEAAGLVKFDFLGLKTLTVLQKTREMLAARGIALDLERLDLADRPSYEMLRRAETVGVFQFESAGMTDLLRNAVPSQIEDLIALVALYRPGPMENIPKYLACKHGREEREHLHETIAPVVEDTYGVIIYQEQVMQIAQVFAGYSLGQADLLRRAMGKKIKSEMQAQRSVFVEGAKARGVETGRAAYVFDLVDKFAGYGFNKAHSAGYGLLAYQTAYLKANYPTEFLAASMVLDQGNTDRLNLFRQELERLSIRLLPPDVNRSLEDFSVERDEGATDGTADGEGKAAVRYGLAAIRNVGREAMRAMVAERRANGPFRDLRDFAGRIDAAVLNKRQLEALAAAGAFDALNPNRAQVFAGVERLHGFAQSLAAERDSAQVNLFGDADGDSGLALKLDDVAPWSSAETLEREFDAVGFYLSAHPLDAYSQSLRTSGVIRHHEIARAPRVANGNGANGNGGVNGSGNGSTQANRSPAYRIAGTVLKWQQRRSARGGKPFAFVQLSDPGGIYEVMVFEPQLTTAREVMTPGRSVVMTVEARRERDEREDQRLSVLTVSAIEDLTPPGGSDLMVYVNDACALPGLRALLEQQAEQGRSSLWLTLPSEQRGREIEICLGRRYRLTAHLRQAIKSIGGVVDVREAGGT